ncbi:hypothetical protein [Roseovarius marisflavi]|nr:hypothetical protein [Roseovarius marisflavi]
MADAPHAELARQRWISRGQILKTIWLCPVEGPAVDITDQVMSGRLLRSGESYGYLFEPDAQKAALALIDEVETDPISFDAALHLVSEEIRLGKAVPYALRDWVADVLVGKLKRPKLNGKYKSATEKRDRLIVQLIKDVMEATNLSPTSGRREHGQSACNAVADGLQLSRLQPDSYESIIKIWGRRKDLSGFNSLERV